MPCPIFNISPTTLASEVRENSDICITNRYHTHQSPPNSAPMLMTYTVGVRHTQVGAKDEIELE